MHVEKYALFRNFNFKRRLNQGYKTKFELLNFWRILPKKRINKPIMLSVVFPTYCSVNIAICFSSKKCPNFTYHRF